jgi:hypothetical protein
MADSLLGIPSFAIDRLPEALQPGFRALYQGAAAAAASHLEPNQVYQGDACERIF